MAECAAQALADQLRRAMATSIATRLGVTALLTIIPAVMVVGFFGLAAVGILGEALEQKAACLPVVHLVDNPGFMIGLEAERLAELRQAGII